jgi:hypothetical protein
MALAHVSQPSAQHLRVVNQPIVSSPPAISRRRAIVAVTLICLAIAAVSAVVFAPRSTSDKAAKGFELVDVRDTDQRVTYAAGVPTVLVFASSWSDSDSTLSKAASFAASNLASEIDVLALLVKDSPLRAQESVDRSLVNFRAGLDPSGTVADEYGVTRLPAVVTLDAQGLVVGRQQGVTNDDQFDKAIEQLKQRTQRTTNGSN